MKYLKNYNTHNSSNRKVKKSETTKETANTIREILFETRKKTLIVYNKQLYWIQLSWLLQLLTKKPMYKI